MRQGIPARIASYLLAAAMVAGLHFVPVREETGRVADEPYLLDTPLLSRSICFENPTGAPGEGGKAKSNLGVGRKGAPAITLKAGQEVQLCDIEGPGTIRHIWMTTSNNPMNLRSLVIRAWWDGQAHPSVECPIGDFMGFAHGKVTPLFLRGPLARPQRRA